MQTDEQDLARLHALPQAERDAMEFERAFFTAIVQARPANVDALRGLAHATTTLGLYREGLAADRAVCALEPENAIDRYNLACSLALTGQLEQAMEALRRAAALGYREWAHMRADADLAALHSTPAFEAFLRQAGRGGA